MNTLALKGLIPSKVLDELPATIEKFSLGTPVLLSHFLGQCHHESGGFRHVFENLNYSAEALLRIWPARFADAYEAQFFAGRPEHIANRVYSRRMGNGGDPSGDGWNYRGRGYIQLTGRHNYTEFDKVVPDNILEYPDLVATKYPLFSAGWYWSYRYLNDSISSKHKITETDIMRVTRRVNGGSHGLKQRIDLTNKIFEVLGE